MTSKPLTAFCSGAFAASEMTAQFYFSAGFGKRRLNGLGLTFGFMSGTLFPIFSAVMGSFKRGPPASASGSTAQRPRFLSELNDQTQNRGIAAQITRLGTIGARHD